MVGVWCDTDFRRLEAVNLCWMVSTIFFVNNDFLTEKNAFFFQLAIHLAMAFKAGARAVVALR